MSSYLDHLVPNGYEVRTALLDENRSGEHREGLELKERKLHATNTSV